MATQQLTAVRTVAPARRVDPIFALTAAGMFLATAGYLAWMVFGWGGKAATTAADDLGSLAVSALGAALCLAAARAAEGRRRRGWALIGLAALSWSLGEAVWSYLEVFRGHLNPFPSPADAGFLTTAYSCAPPSHVASLRNR